MARLQEFYRDTVVKKLMDERSISNPMDVPRIEKITLNRGVGEAVGDKKVIEHAVSDKKNCRSEAGDHSGA
jgi:large subunit ribosomal protein L5